MLEKVPKAADIPVTPHNTPDEVAGVAVTFATEDDAIVFARRPGVRRLFDSSKHV